MSAVLGFRPSRLLFLRGAASPEGEAPEISPPRRGFWVFRDAYIYIYIYREREREIDTHIYIYIYIHMDFVGEAPEISRPGVINGADQHLGAQGCGASGRV